MPPTARGRRSLSPSRTTWAGSIELRCCSTVRLRRSRAGRGARRARCVSHNPWTPRASTVNIKGARDSKGAGRRVFDGHAGLFVIPTAPLAAVPDPDKSHVPAPPAGLYDRRFEHDACGVGFVARLSGEPGHDIVAKAVEAVANLSHRGAVAADGKSGDGSGVLTQVPRRLLAREVERLRLGRLDETDLLGVGMFFLPSRGGESIVEGALCDGGLRLLGWRDVPIDAD